MDSLIEIAVNAIQKKLRMAQDISNPTEKNFNLRRAILETKEALALLEGLEYRLAYKEVL